MAKFLVGVFVGLVIATFAPKAADLSRDLFEAGRNFGGEVVEKVGNSTSE